MAFSRKDLSVPSGRHGFGSLFQRHSRFGIGLFLAEQVPDGQPKQEVNFAISNDLVKDLHRTPDSHSASAELARHGEMQEFSSRVAEIF